MLPVPASIAIFRAALIPAAPPDWIIFPLWEVIYTCPASKGLLMISTCPESVINPTTLLGFANADSPPVMLILAEEAPSGAPNPSLELLTKPFGNILSTSAGVEPTPNPDEPPRSRVENRRPISLPAIVGLAKLSSWKPFGLMKIRLLTDAVPPTTEMVPDKTDEFRPLTLFKTTADDPLVYSRFSAKASPRPLPHITTALLAPPKLTTPVAEPDTPEYP